MLPAPPGGKSPGLVRPMLATLARELPADETRWAAEFKWDGQRAVCYASGGVLRLRSRSDRDITSTYPELAGLAAAAARRSLILDGEIVVLGEDARPSFAALQRRMHVRRPAARLVAAVPVSYLLFDLMYLDGQALLRSPYEQRRALLEGLHLAAPGVEVPPSFPGGAQDVLAASARLGLEGIVLKRLGSPYRPGRSPLWRKLKCERTTEVVVGGWAEGRGYRAALVGSLILGIHGPAGLTYCGHVGTGFTDAALRDLTRQLRALEQPATPFATPIPPAQARHAHWARPVLVGTVSYTEWTPGGRLRHPAWQGLRTGKDPAEVRRYLSHLLLSSGSQAPLCPGCPPV